MRIKHIIILALFLSGSLELLGQTNSSLSTIKTLQSNILNSPNDTARIRLLNSLAYEYYAESKFDSCLLFASKALMASDSILNTEKAKLDSDYQKHLKVQKIHSIKNIALGIQDSNVYQKVDTLHHALKLAKEIGDKNEEAAIYGALGDVYTFKNQPQLSIENHLLSVDLYKQTANKSAQAKQLTGVAISERQLGNFADALEHLMESLKISREINDSATMVDALLAMGFTYMYVEKWGKALESQQEAMDICILMKDSLGLATVYNDIGVTNMSAGNLDIALMNHQAALNIRIHSTDYFYISSSYFYIGRIYEKKSMLAEALSNYLESHRFAEISGYKFAVTDSHISLGDIYFNLSENDKALRHFKNAVVLSQENEDRFNEALASMKIAGIYISQDKILDGLAWLNRAESVVPKKAFMYLGEIYEMIAQAYFNLGDYKNAYTNLLLYSQVKDSLVVAENLEKFTILSNRLEFENKQALQNESHAKMMEIKQTEIERQKVVRNFSLFGAFVILVLAIIFFIRFVEKKKLNEALNKTLANLKSAQTQLVHAEKMASLGELVAGIAHEIQNPLNFINNFSEVNTELIAELTEGIKKGDFEEAKAIAADIASNEEKIIHHGQRADGIVKGMLQHSRSNGNNKIPTNINTLADEFLRLSYHGLRAKDKTFNADFSAELDKTLPKIEVVPQDIGRVMLNLINNAFYAVSQRAKRNVKDYRPKVIVRTKMENNELMIHVIDNGEGVPEDLIDKIFQPFFTTKAAGEGTGLGLSLSYDIITKGHGGELKVNTTEGKGTEFIIHLPI